MLTAALGRSGSDGSATEAFRAGLAQAADTSTIRAVLAEALRRVDALAGPDRSTEIERVRQKVAGRSDDTGEHREAARLSALVVAQQARSEWLGAHPEVVAYLSNLAQRLRESAQLSAFGEVAQPGAAAFRAPNSGPEV